MGRRKAVVKGVGGVGRREGRAEPAQDLGKKLKQKQTKTVPSSLNMTKNDKHLNINNQSEIVQGKV